MLRTCKSHSISSTIWERDYRYSHFIQGNGDIEKSSNLPKGTQQGFKLKCLEPLLPSSLPTYLPSQLSFQRLEPGMHDPVSWSPTAQLTTCVNSYSNVLAQALNTLFCLPAVQILPIAQGPSSNPTVPTKPFTTYMGHFWMYWSFSSSVPHCSLLYTTPIIFNCPWVYSPFISSSPPNSFLTGLWVFFSLPLLICRTWCQVQH